MEKAVLKCNETISELSDSLKAQKDGSNPFQKVLCNEKFWDEVESILKMQKVMGMDAHHREEVLKCAQKHFKDFDDGELD